MAGTCPDIDSSSLHWLPAQNFMLWDLSVHDAPDLSTWKVYGNTALSCGAVYSEVDYACIHTFAKVSPIA